MSTFDDFQNASHDNRILLQLELIKLEISEYVYDAMEERSISKEGLLSLIGDKWSMEDVRRFLNESEFDLHFLAAVCLALHLDIKITTLSS